MNYYEKQNEEISENINENMNDAFDIKDRNNAVANNSNDALLKLYNITVQLQPDGDELIVEKKYTFKKPSMMSFNRYVKTINKDLMTASIGILVDNIIDEQYKQLSEDLKEYPAMTLSLSEKLLYTLGMAKDGNFKRL